MTLNRIIYALMAAAGLIVLLMAFLIWRSPLVYDTDHLGDTLFIMGAAWRTFSGLQPTIGFNHFYGGLSSNLIGMSMYLFGPSVKAFDYALILLFGMTGCFLACICWKRVSLSGFVISLCFIATLAFTRYPLEVGQAITELYSTHSFLYNRIGLILFLITGLYAALPSRTRNAEIIAGFLAGVLLLGVALAKPTFLILMPMAAFAVIIQSRWHGLLALCGGFLIALAIFDPWAGRWISSYAYVQASVGDRADAQVSQLIRKAVLMPLVQPVALGMVCASLCILLFGRPRPWRQIIATGVITIAGLGMATTMGGGGSYGHLAIPVLGFTLIAGAELANRFQPSAPRISDLMAGILVAAFMIPHSINLLGTTLDVASLRDQTLIHEGPMAAYIAVSKENAGRLSSVKQYRMLADGISALHGLGDMSDMGIIADNGISFEFALKAAPVADYPLWPRAHSPELAPDLPLPDDVTIVLLGNGAHRDPDIGTVLRAKLTDAFRHCLTTTYWEIYLRGDAGSGVCQR